jgi:hypothetical protein
MMMRNIGRRRNVMTTRNKKENHVQFTRELKKENKD